VLNLLRRFVTRRLTSFRYAFAGLAYVLRSQHNAWIHGAITVLVVLMSFWLGLSRNEWALIVVTITVVWTAEILNTAIEATVDLISPQPHPLARIAKDCAAAAVLVTAGMAVVIGLLLLGPALWERLGL
jgi:diacylglycerol kinase